MIIICSSEIAPAEPWGDAIRRAPGHRMLESDSINEHDCEGPRVRPWCYAERTAPIEQETFAMLCAATRSSIMVSVARAMARAQAGL
jgi:hypothetical protein